MAAPYPVSILDLATVRHGQPIAESLKESTELAVLADELGFHRLWFAEHHNMATIASSATSVLLAHMGAHTTNIRLGAGGIMLPNHAPLVIAEQFGTLHELYGDRIDLGLGRAPGTDQKTLMALRRTNQSADRFPSDVLELQSYLKGESRIPGINAYPGTGTNVPLILLGSSHFGAQLAAQLGLSYSFASHFAPQMLESAAALYRSEFTASKDLAEPYFIAAANVIIADTQQRAEELWERAKRARIRSMLGRGRQLSDDDVEQLVHSVAGQQVLQMLEMTAVGTPAVVRDWLDDFVSRMNANEVIVTNMAGPLEDRRRALQLISEHIIQR
ncbi:MAG TPA: LLM class flavin-dependent oxidoreductase [Enteractinococcus helveticum]|uniref:LLM class flavin-dependent oxidoreductase n=1 Tax=Enteractinococcus helveticum TaxID=1837282 RepID=A0A921FL33_9MICC|nr:LLM class flavin-dependent oxidoreductase [Enteractinococcus helveticum]HJF13272.1 LLM class flavin-dependent oxidoreductase [Enteractinococcus helveticum]